jgi:hypothetical protein
MPTTTMSRISRIPHGKAHVEEVDETLVNFGSTSPGSAFGVIVM